METFKTENLSFSYPEQAVPAISDISLTVERGSFFVICGHSGCGKSTLLRRLKPSVSPRGTQSGEIYFCGEPLGMLSERDAAAKIGFVLQSPDSQIVTDKVWHELAFGLESLGLDDGIIRRRCAEMAAFFGIEEWYYKNVSELSGGQKQLLSLASVMAMQPEVLILDEPTAQLDPIAASEFLSTLGRINRGFGTTVILSEHRLEEALVFADKAAVMENGKILCCGSPREVGKLLREKRSNMFSAMPAAMRIWSSVQSGLPCPVTVNEGRAFVEEYMKTKAPAALPERGESRGGRVMLSASEVWFRYEKTTPDVVKGLEFSARSGEMLCILGGNGSGKTTSLRLLAGIKNPYRGEIKRGGKTGFLPQNPQSVFVKKTVREDLTEVLKLAGVPRERRDGEMEKIADLCRLGGLLDRHPYDLSGGEQQRAALAKILLLSPEILLLDEPTKGLDAPFKEAFAEILQRLKNSGVCIVVVSHDVEFCAKYADRCGLFFDGRLATAAPPREFFSGNSFYTTSANRIASEIEPMAVTTEDVIAVIGGKGEKIPVTSETAPVIETSRTDSASAARKFPLWRKAGAAVSGLSALALFIYAAKNEDLRAMVDKGGLTAAGMKQLAFYGAFILLLALFAAFIGRRQETRLPLQTPAGERRIPKRTIAACVMILLFVPLTLFIGIFYLGKKQYYLTSFAVLIECMLPFFLVFEGRKPKARELVTVATLCALTVAGRAAFFMLPQFKPVMALTIISGVALGGETGFLVGAVSMLVSNILFSQGPWTPWQMFAMGIIGFLAGVLYRKGLLMRSRASLAVFGAVCAILIYGGIMNPASALIWGGESLNFRLILSYYATGFPMDAVHAAATALFLWFGAEPLLEKLDRIKTKYGLCE